MDYASMLNAVITLATIATLSAVGITIYDTVRARRKSESTIQEAEEPKTSILQKIIPKREEAREVRENGGIKIILDMPREITIKVDPNDLIAFLFSNRRKTKKVEIEEVEEEGEEEEGSVSTEVLLRKGLLKEG